MKIKWSLTCHVQDLTTMFLPAAPGPVARNSELEISAISLPKWNSKGRQRVCHSLNNYRLLFFTDPILFFRGLNHTTLSRELIRTLSDLPLCLLFHIGFVIIPKGKRLVTDSKLETHSVEVKVATKLTGKHACGNIKSTVIPLI